MDAGFRGAILLIIGLVGGCREEAAGPGQDPAPDTADTRRSDTSDTAPPTGRVRINEVLSDGEDGLEDGDGDASDWIELRAVEAVDLAGWALTDDPTDPGRWTLPARTMVPGELLVVFASGKGETGPPGELHAPFRLDADGERLELREPDGALSDRVEIPPLPPGVSWGPEQPVRVVSRLGTGAPARLAREEVVGWTAPGFDDAAWAAVVLPVGWDLGAGEVSVNAALERATTQSSNGYGLTGLQAVDGEPGTFSHTGDGDLAPWWSVDLGADWMIAEVTVLNRVDCCADRLYNLSVTVLDSAGAPGWSGGPLNTVVEGQVPPDPGPVHTFTPTVPVRGRSVRLDKAAVNGAGSSEWLSLAEVVVTARPAAPYGTLLGTDLGEGGAGLWLRAPFTVEERADRAVLELAWDDEVAAWMDGAPVAEDADGQLHDGAAPVRWALAPPEIGAHLLALRVGTLDATDLLAGATLELQSFTTGNPAFFEAPTPGEPNGEGVAGLIGPPGVDPPRGFYDAPIAVTVQSDVPGATLVYTLDGSLPTPDHGTRVEAVDAATPPSVVVQVATTAVLRAAAFRDGWGAGEVATHTYLFLADVLRQPAAPAGLPVIWDGMSEGAVPADYEMDPEVVEDPATAAELLDGMRAIPTLSVVLEPDDLWSDTDGIYVHSAERGDAWERPASLELILPDGSTGFATTCGIQVHGYGWRYHSATKKHSFRLQFSADYGPKQLEYPLFPDSGADAFDSIVLRAGGSKTWLDFRDPAQAQYLHDAFARDTARDMGKADGHATYVHLYLNGLYWGLYNPVERPDAGFGERYFGGDDDEYDAINRRTVTNEAIDGTLEAYNAMLVLAEADLSAGYVALEAMLDIDDLIDYMLIHQYMVNRDGPCCAESNNMRGVRRRVEGEQFRFFVWDMEYSLWDATDATNVEIDVPGSISHVYTRLRQNADFRARYAARARLHLTGQGALTPMEAAARYQARAEEIHAPLLAESARWGDTYRARPYTRDVEWQAEYTRLMEEFFPARTDLLIAQLTEAGLWVP